MDAELARRSAWTEKIDDIVTHPVFGVVVFQVVMLVALRADFLGGKNSDGSDRPSVCDRRHVGRGALMPAGDLQSLIVNGVIAGVGGILVFLPQICILFFALSLLEDTGYLARAAFVMDKVMRRFGLPGKAFVPMLSAHACAIPAIMSARVIENPRDRLVTILITPLMTCSARIPVYAMVTALIFPDSPLKAALIFTSAYAIGILAALGCALLFKHTILPGGSKPLMIELPPYRLPGLRTALLHTFDRAKIFVKQAGTIILAISLVLWALSHYPKSAPPRRRRRAAGAGRATGKIRRRAESRCELRADAEPPDRAIFAAKFLCRQNRPCHRAGHPAARLRLADRHRHLQLVCRARSHRLHARHRLWRGRGRRRNITARRFTTRCAAPSGPTARRCSPPRPALSLLVFYILAAQCLSTTAVVRRETNSWKWPLFQIAYMTGLAYVAALIVYQAVSHFVH